MRYISAPSALNIPFSFLILFTLIICPVFSYKGALAADKVVVVPLMGRDRSAIPVDDIVDLALFASAGTSGNFTRYNSSGSVMSNNYAVPSGKTFVICSITISPTVYGNSSMLVTMKQNSITRKVWYISQAMPSHFTFPSGIVINSNFLLGIYNGVGNPSGVYVQVNGYHIDS